MAAKIKGGIAVLWATMLFVMGTAPNMVTAASFTCREAQRHSFAVTSSMTPAYPGRTIDFTINGSDITANGVFFHTAYDVTYLSDQAADLSFGPMPQMRIVKTSFCLLNKRFITQPS